MTTNPLPQNAQLINASKGKVNFLGSSYSGVDIKLVAHVYTSKDISQENNNLLKDYTIAVEILYRLFNGLYTSVGTVSPSNASRKYNTFVAQATNSLSTIQDQRTKQDILNGVINPLISLPGQLKGTKSPFGAAATASVSNVDRYHQRYKALIEQQKTFNSNKDNSIKNTSTTIELGDLQTISVSTYREKNAVRAMGISHIKGYTRGPRTIAGSMIFTVFEQHPLRRLIISMSQHGLLQDPMFNTELNFLMPDQLPPIDMTAIFANEYGSLSKFTLLGVEFVNDGVTYSIEDIMTEQVIQFVARDLEVLTSAGTISLDSGFSVQEQTDAMPGTKLLTSNNEYQAYLERLGLKRRFSNR